MTTISAIQGSGWAVLSCDSRVTSENEISHLPFEMNKVVENGKYLIGVAGKYKAIPLLAYVFSPTQAPVTARGLVLDKFMTRVFMPELEAFLTKHLPPTPATVGEEATVEDFEFLVIVNGVIYIIGAEFTWSREASCLYSIGSGSDYAMGSLLTTTSGSDVASAEKRTRRSVEVASQRDTNTGGEIRSFSQIAKSKK